MNYFYDTFPTPLGEFSVAVNSHGSIVATAFGDASELRQRFNVDELVRDPIRVVTARKQITEYFAGKRSTFDLKLAPAGSPFQHAVWTGLQAIPFGETRSYASLAESVDRPGAARAVGRANATNPICLIIPCHRVIGSDGSLTGFAFGEEIKRKLLDHESALATA